MTEEWPPKLGPDAVKVLEQVLREAMDGYSLMKLTRLDASQLVKAVQELVNSDLLSVKGYITEDDIGESYLALRPGVIKIVQQLMKRLKSTS